MRQISQAARIRSVMGTLAFQECSQSAGELCAPYERQAASQSRNPLQGNMSDLACAGTACSSICMR
jgi:hypothetical protein